MTHLKKSVVNNIDVIHLQTFNKVCFDKGTSSPTAKAFFWLQSSYTNDFSISLSSLADIGFAGTHL